MSNSNSNIYPTLISWNTATSEYWEVFTKKKHICPNLVNKSITVTDKPLDVQNCTSESINPTSYPTASRTTTTNTKPTYYSKKPWSTQPKPRCLTH
jgi:hypothetical protein